jgi:hypothetical protein
MQVPHSQTSEAKPCGLNKAQVQSVAAQVAKKLGYKPGDELAPLVKKIGGKIEVASWDEVGTTGSITVRAAGDFTISLSPLSGNRRDRFTIAHELGHYVLHSEMGKKAPLSVRRDGSDRVEWEANWFAAGFLMPEAEFRKLAGEGWSNSWLAVHFDVSEAAVEVRRMGLGL